MCAPQVIEAIQERLGRRQFLGAAAGAAALGFLAVPLQEAPAAQYRTPSKGGAQAPPAQRGRRTVVSLSYVLTPQFPIWPGLPVIEITKIKDHDKDGFYANTWTLVEHHGTHVDAPIHFAKGKWSADEIPDSSLVAPAVVIHINDRAKSDPDVVVTVDDLQAWEQKYGNIPAGAAVLMHSGWEVRSSDQASYRNADAQNVMHFPGFSKEAAQFLVRERAIAGIGVDTLSLDPGNSKDFPAHVTVLGANRWGIENLTNLGKVPDTGALVFVGIPRVKGASGGPARVLATW